MKVLVNGIGNIGTTLLDLLVDYQTELGISAVHAFKNRPVTAWQLPDLERLQRRGVILHAKTPGELVGVRSVESLEASIDYVFDCTANGMGLKNKTWYERFSRLQAACVQGSEAGFGLPYMTGINDEACSHARWVQIVSCNTHGMAAVLKAFSPDFSAYTDVDFVVVRRSEDLGNHERLVSANVASRHRSADFGTHHATDLDMLLQTVGVTLAVQSSDVTTPSQLMHALRFNLGFTEEAWIQRGPKPDYASCLLVARSAKFDSNIIFEAGRRHGPSGRIFSQAIIIDHDLLYDQRFRRVKGWAFIPQEGNTFLSILRAYLLQTGNASAGTIYKRLCTELTQAVW